MTTKWSDVKLTGLMTRTLRDADIDPAIAKIGLDAIIGFIKALAAADPPLRIVDEREWLRLQRALDPERLALTLERELHLDVPHGYPAWMSSRHLADIIIADLMGEDPLEMNGM